MMLRVLPDLCHKSSAFQSIVRRCFSKSSSTYRDNDKVNDDISLPGHDGENGCASKEKFPYPEISVKSTLISFPYDNEENPFVRTGKALKFDFDVAKARIQGRPPPPTPVESDIVIIGGGVVGSSIAHHLSERCGPGLNISVVEMDSPYLSTSLRVGRNDLYQQVNLKPNVEMALYAAEYYRKLCKHQNPDLPQMSIDFQPNSSLCLASAEGAAELEDRAEMYRELDWRHQLLTPSLLKERFPWMNMDGVAVGCLGLNREGICNKLKAVSAMRARAKQVGVNFIEGKLVGFQFIDQTDLLTGYEQQARYYAPRRVVIQSKTGELSRLTFGYLILAAGVSIQDLLHKINIAQVSMNVPIEAEERFAFNFVCPNGPGIEMPMIMESGGFRFRKADIVNSYTVWEEQSPSKEVPKNYSMDSMNTYFSENILPRLIQRVPSFKDAKLTSFDHGLVDVCTWDNNLFVGPVLGFYNVLQTGGFGNDEFLYAPAVGRGMAELILDREFEALDLSCFRHERTAENVKINEVLDSFLRHNSNIPKQ